MRHAMVLFVAAICVAFTFNICQGGYGDESKLDSVYQRFAGDSKQGIDAGWIPREELGTEYSDARAGSFGTDREARRESLRRAYKGITAGVLPGTYATFTATEEDLEVTHENCPPHVCKNGDCQANYIAMFSMSWCGPCKRMYKVVEELRKEGYVIYVFVCDDEKFKDLDLDAKFDIKMFPTFVEFDKGQEVKRKVGVTNKQWFRDNLQTRDEQEAEVEEPENPYDGL